MSDPIYAGVNITADNGDCIMLHAVNNLYKVANNMLLIISKMPDDVRENIFKELKMPEHYTMSVMNEQKDMSYNTLHYELLNKTFTGLNEQQSEYLKAFRTFFKNIYPVIYMQIAPTVERDKNVKYAYESLTKCSKHLDKIFIENLLGHNVNNKLMIDMLTKQVKDIVEAQKMADNLKKDLAEDNDTAGNDTRA